MGLKLTKKNLRKLVLREVRRLVELEGRSCPEGEEWDPEGGFADEDGKATGACVPSCPDGQVWDPKAFDGEGDCVDIKEKSEQEGFQKADPNYKEDKPRSPIDGLLTFAEQELGFNPDEWE
jgi:hypothetical protein